VHSIRREVRDAQVEQDLAMRAAGCEPRRVECVGCQETERRLAFSGDKKAGEFLF
jgi:hypothetical protein